MILNKTNTLPESSESIIFLIQALSELSTDYFSADEITYMKEKQENEQKTFSFNRLSHLHFVVLANPNKEICPNENLRLAANDLLNQIHNHRIETIYMVSNIEAEKIVAFAEGLVLGSYQFLKYFSDKDKKQHSLKSVSVVNDNVSEENLTELNIQIKANFLVRDLVNEPMSYLNAEKFAEIATQKAKALGCNVEVFYKEKIQSLKMGGVLAVNQGSAFSPTFSIVEWKPQNASNTQPLVLVGKGVVFDTGGYSLKPTKNSMDTMKCDMAGAATVLGVLTAVAEAKLPVHVIGLMPATDNSVNEYAYVPGDVITMHNKKTVEVLNTDAEGRLLLADALSYAKAYNPQLTIDLATLTGSAAFAIGKQAAVIMGTADNQTFEKINQAATQTCERVVQFPFWDDYSESLKSQIADLKNIGGPEAGAITAGKFLEHFVDYPWVHIDIAGPAFVSSAYNYKGNGATGYGVRMLFQFIKQYVA